MSESSAIEFYFDPISPYAWLASSQIQKIEIETQREVIAVPILFAGLLKAHGHRGPAEIPAKRLYTFRDVMRRAQAYELPIQGAPQHPFNPLLGLRVCTTISDNQVRMFFAKKIMDAVWQHGLDITLEKTVKDVASACGIDPETAINQAGESQVKSALIRATERAVGFDIFGVPTFRVNGELFWGDDRVEDLIRHCQGELIDQTLLDDILNRPAAAQRR